MTIDDARAELARIYREAKAGTRKVEDFSKLANGLQILAKMIEGADLQERYEQLRQEFERVRRQDPRGTT